MNPEIDEPPDDLTRDYRRASAAEAGRPAAATRAAILAEARAASLRGRRAANDSVWWRAAASVAVVGVGLLIWRQVDRPVAPLAPAAGVAADTQADVPSQPQVQATAKARAPAEPAPAAPAAPAAPPAAPPAANGAAAGAISAAASSAAAERLARRAEREDRASVAQAIDMPPSPPRTTLARSDAASTNATGLLQERFPAENASSTPPRGLWVLRDEAGAVLRSGRLNDNVDFAAVTQRLQPEFPGRRIGPWDVTPVSNAQGVAVQLGVAIVR